MWKLSLIVVSIIMITPGVMSINHDNSWVRCPCHVPTSVWGYAYFEGALMEGKTLLGQIDGMTYGCDVTDSEEYPGLFCVDVYGDETMPDDIKTGGYPNDLIIFVYQEGNQTYYADYTTTWELGKFNLEPIIFTFSSDWPFQMKINEICTDDGSGLQYVGLYNPSSSPINLDEYYLENDGGSFGLTGTIDPGDDFHIDLGSNGFLSTTADHLKLVWANQYPVIADGHDVTIDRAEYGEQSTEPENTNMPDAVSPPPGWCIKRVPDGQDTDDCAADFQLRGAIQTYYIQLEAGPNLISVPLEVEDECIICVLSSVNWIYAEWCDAFDDADHWKTHLRTRPMPLNDFTAVNHTKGFWLTVPFPQTLAVTGNGTTSTTIPLRAGWNYVGYPSLSTRPLSLALAGTGYDRVEGFDEAAPYHLSPLPDNYLMTPGEGYRVHVPADTTWLVDW
jgi:hypothetical protein